MLAFVMEKGKNQYLENNIWEEICWPYKAPFWCHIFCIFEHLFWQLRGVLCQNFQHFLKIYECQIVYIPLFWPVLHRGPVQLPIHFTLPQKIVAFQNIICSLFSPFFVLFSNMIDRYDAQGYPVCLEGHLLPLKPKIKGSWHTSAIYGWKTTLIDNAISFALVLCCSPLL